MPMIIQILYDSVILNITMRLSASIPQMCKTTNTIKIQMLNYLTQILHDNTKWYNNINDMISNSKWYNNTNTTQPRIR